ncbi:MAG: DUF4398 domain-containing protein [Deltaproteobacteria bacterium]|nr:MAG: DUF4398 domain-containing protein [Deltaproteobacteria bacterium]
MPRGARGLRPDHLCRRRPPRVGRRRRGPRRPGREVRAVLVDARDPVPPQGARGRRACRLPGRRPVRPARRRGGAPRRRGCADRRQGSIEAAARRCARCRAGQGRAGRARARSAAGQGLARAREAAGAARRTGEGHTAAAGRTGEGSALSRRAIRVALVIAHAVALAGCAGERVRVQTTATARLIATARQHGAQRCAPVDLAMAESHNDFAQHALDEGNYQDARREAEVAETNAQLAIEKSPQARCVDKDALLPGPGDMDGDGIPDDVDQCPRVPEDRDGFQDADGCPDDDNDGDGITDKLDKCPDEPEDRDGFEDADGCPDPDNDKDGIPDAADKCPNEPEDRDGFEDADGCPDPDNDKDGIPDVADKCPNEPGVAPDGCPKKYSLVVVTEKKIELKQTVYFDTNRATIKRVSFPLLNEVAQALLDNPAIKVEIQGHTDSQGRASSNLKLSQKRAEAVRTYLIKRSVASDRMVAKGYGKDVPIADNRTSEGRSQNRRVEFVITPR